MFSRLRAFFLNALLRDTVLGLVGSVVFLSLYFHDVQKFSNYDEFRDEIGEVTQSIQDVQRRPQNRLLWNDLPEQKKVYPQDTIRTGKNSTARIRLGRDGEIDVKSDSLVVLETEARKVSVHLASGDLFLSGSAVAKTDESEILISGGRASLHRDASGALKIESSSGKTVLRTGNQSREIKAGQLLTQSRDGQQLIESYKVSRQSPQNGSIIFIESEGKIDFNVEEVEKNTPSPLRLQISESSRFKKIQLQSDFKEGHVILGSTALREGRFFWRVVDSKGQVLSSAGNFETRALPRLSWRQKGKPSLQVDTDGLSTDLRWQGPKDFSRFKVSILQKDRIIWETIVEGQKQLVWKKSKNELWETFQKNSVNADEGLRIEITSAQASLKLAEPLRADLIWNDGRLALPPLEAKIEVDTQDPRRARLSWTPSPGVKLFEVKLGSQRRRVETPLLDIKSSDLFKLGTDEKIEIFSVGDNQKIGQSLLIGIPDREVFALESLAAQSPETLYPIDATNIIKRGRSTLRFEWSPLGNAHYSPKEFELELKPRDRKAQNFTIAGGSNSLEIPLPEAGNFSWRLRALWEKVGAGPQSAAKSFKINAGAPLEAPQLRRPASQSSDFE